MMQAAKGSYVLPLAGSRDVPEHQFTVSSMAQKRFRENTSVLAVTVGFVLPTLMSVNKKLEKHVNDGTDVPMDELADIFVDSAKDAGVSYADRLARVTCQTALACVLIETKGEVANSMVYLWDLYPRLHYRYIGGVCRALRIPTFLAALIGPAPTTRDVAFLESAVTPVGAFEDSVKRNIIILFGDVIVDTTRLCLDKRVKNRNEAIVNQITTRVTSTLCCAAGAAVGRLVLGEKGEYYGEIAGMVFAPVVVGNLSKTLLQLRTARKNGGSSRHRMPSQTAGSSAAPKTATA